MIRVFRKHVSLVIFTLRQLYIAIYLQFATPYDVRKYKIKLYPYRAAASVSAAAADWIPLEYTVTLENRSPLHFQMSQCIPMGPNLPLTLTLGVGIPLGVSGHKRTIYFMVTNLISLYHF